MAQRPRLQSRAVLPFSRHRRPPIRVGFVEVQPLLRQVLARIVSEEPGMRVVRHRVDVAVVGRSDEPPSRLLGRGRPTAVLSLADGEWAADGESAGVLWRLLPSAFPIVGLSPETFLDALRLVREASV